MTTTTPTKVHCLNRAVHRKRTNLIQCAPRSWFLSRMKSRYITLRTLGGGAGALLKLLLKCNSCSSSWRSNRITLFELHRGAPCAAPPTRATNAKKQSRHSDSWWVSQDDSNLMFNQQNLLFVNRVPIVKRRTAVLGTRRPTGSHVWKERKRKLDYIL